MPSLKHLILLALALVGCLIMADTPLSLHRWTQANGNPDLGEKFQIPIDEVEINYQSEASIPSPSFYINTSSKFLGGLGLVVIAIGITGYRRKLTEIGSVLLGQFLLLSIFTLVVT